MERNRKIQIYCLFAASLFLGIFGAVCLYLGIAGEYNDAMGHFNTDSLFAPVAYLCILAGPVFGIVGWVLFRKNAAPDRALSGGIVVKAVSCISSALIIFSVFSEIYGYLNASFRSIGVETVLFWVLAVLAAVSLVASSFSPKDIPVNPWVSLLAFAPVIYCAGEVLILYFDQSVAVNSPIKFICQLTYLAYMLMFCSEAGLSLGRGKIYPRYIFTLCCAVAIGGTGALGALLATVTGARCAAFTSTDTYVKAGLFLYACVRFALSAKMETAEVEKKSKEDEITAEKPEEKAFE